VELTAHELELDDALKNGTWCSASLSAKFSDGPSLGRSGDRLLIGLALPIHS